MKKSEWNEALNYIDDDIVANFVAKKEMLQKKKRTKKIWIRVCAIAACLAIIITAVFAVLMLVKRDGALFWDSLQINGSDSATLPPSFDGVYVQPPNDYGSDGAEEGAFNYDFHAYLDSIPFKERMDEKLLTEILSRYKYEGKSITNLVLSMYGDGIDGGGYSAFHREGMFSYSSLATFNDDEGYVICSNDFHTEVQLEGLVLPRMIVFEDSIVDALKKLKIDLYSGKYNSTYEDGNLTIYENENESFKLQRTDDNGYLLIYTENYLSSRDNKSVVTRKLSMLFDSDNNYKLSNFYIYAEEKSYYTAIEPVPPEEDDKTDSGYTVIEPVPPNEEDKTVDISITDGILNFSQLKSASVVLQTDDGDILIEDDTFIEKLGNVINGKRTTKCDCKTIYHVEIGGYFLYFHTHDIAIGICDEYSSSVSYSVYTVECTEEEMKDLCAILEATKQSSV